MAINVASLWFWWYFSRRYGVGENFTDHCLSFCTFRGWTTSLGSIAIEFNLQLEDEFKKFAPQLDVAVSYGLKPKRDEIIAEDHQIIITSYASFRQDFDVL